MISVVAGTPEDPQVTNPNPNPTVTLTLTLTLVGMVVVCYYCDVCEVKCDVVLF